MKSTTPTHEKSSDSRTPNRLIHETSTYLLQHAHNPVDWFPWGEEALKKARDEDKPILLSVGYSACHWCHVMEHESFEDEETAEIMNANFVNIKVDREERSDIDEIYMKAVQMMTGHGGWPMTVFLTPELKPFFGGTYFPKEDRYQLPSFKRLLLALSEAWKERRGEVEESSASITEHLQALDDIDSSAADAVALRKLISEKVLVDCADRLLRIFDHRWGGFGTAPKFPHTFSLSLSMRCSDHLAGASSSTKEEHRELVTTTLDKMAYGGIHDQIGGGFARYSVDRQWLVPHFEKMLYDNALLCQTYLDGYALHKRDYWRDVACGILDFVMRELTTEEGAFYSSLDADSEGEEGKFYVWDVAEVKAVLGEEDGKWICDVYGVTPAGNFEHGKSVLHLTDSPEELAKKYKMSLADFWEKVRKLNAKLLKERDTRIRPGRDEKVLTSWNSLMISAFVDGFKATREMKYIDCATRATNFILSELTKDGRLLRTWGQGKAKLNAYLDDYAYFVQALLDLAAVDPNPIWFIKAQELTGVMIDRFWDPGDRGLYYTSDDHETLVVRPRSHFDGSVPSGTSVATFNLLRLGHLTGDESYHKRAEVLLALYGPYFAKMPDQFANMVCAADYYLSNSPEIVVITDGNKGSWEEMMFALHERYLPNKAVLISTTDSALRTPLIEGRGLKDGKATAYVCRNYTCSTPVNDPEALKNQLQTLSSNRGQPD
ncbi:MAG TPA: thioredoxin domain-containing protein [Candidatus Obscuribacterales bacterium]